MTVYGIAINKESYINTANIINISRCRVDDIIGKFALKAL